MNSELSPEQIRRDLREADLVHRQAMPGFRRVVRRVFLSGQTTPAQQSQLVLGGLSRRNVLKIGGATIIGGVVLAACGDDDDDTSAPTTAATEAPTDAATEAPTEAPTDAPASGDVLILRTASSIEALAVAAYQIAIDSGLVTDAAVGEAAMLFQSHHAEHLALFEAATSAAGGQPFSDPNPAVLAAIQPTIDALTDQAGVLALAYDLEVAAAQTYQSNVTAFTDPALNETIMSIGGVEARHAALIASVLGNPAVPKAFQVTELAVAAGTGVS